MPANMMVLNTFTHLSICLDDATLISFGIHLGSLGYIHIVAHLFIHLGSVFHDKSSRQQLPANSTKTKAQNKSDVLFIFPCQLSDTDTFLLIKPSWVCSSRVYQKALSASKIQLCECNITI